MPTRAFYMDDSFAEQTSPLIYDIKSEPVNANINELRVSYTNPGAALKYIPVFELSVPGAPFFYMTPCVNYNGNDMGTGIFPRGMTYEGEPWIFPAERNALPGCSIAQTQDGCFAMFARGECASSSIFVNGGETVLRVYFSHVEYPKSYNRKYELAAPQIDYITIDAGETQTFICFAFQDAINAENPYYSYSKLFDYANADFVRDFPARYSAAQIGEWSFSFMRAMTEQTPRGLLSNMGLLPNGEHRLGDANSKFEYRKINRFEIGWCGQNSAVAELYLRDYIKTGERESLTRALGILDSWLARQYPSGAFSVTCDADMKPDDKLDTCNEGCAMYRFVNCLELLDGLAIDADKLRAATRLMCEFFISRYPEGGFPQVILPDGEIVNNIGCAGTMLVMGLARAYGYFDDGRILNRAISAYRFYYDNYLARSFSGGGALDTYCTDKESAGPLLRAAVMLYQITGEPRYLCEAENIAHYLMSWCFYHDVKFDAESDCGILGLRTTGATSVSAAHHHLDCWAVFYVPDMYELYKITGNAAYLRQAKILWSFQAQYISDGSLALHGMTRPAGAQNEAVFQCGWSAGEARGQMNDWLVNWVKVFQLDAIERLKDTGFFEE